MSTGSRQSISRASRSALAHGKSPTRGLRSGSPIHSVRQGTPTRLSLTGLQSLTPIRGTIQLQNGAQQKDASSQFKDAILQLYREKAPERLASIDDLFTTYKGEEGALYCRLCSRFGVDPRAELAPAVAHAPSPGSSILVRDDLSLSKPNASPQVPGSASQMCRPGGSLLKPHFNEKSPLWPLAKLHLALGADRGNQRTKAVLLTTGAMNPMHAGHKQMLHQARHRLDQEGYQVLTSWLSPSHDLYVQPKANSLGTPGLSSDLRLQLAHLSCQDDAFVSVSSWEASQKGRWPDFPKVAQALQDEMAAKAPEMRCTSSGHIHVFYVCGSDHADRCGLYEGLCPSSGIGVVVVPREGDRPEAENAGKLVFVAEPSSREVASYSSTKVRAALRDGDAAYVGRAMSQEAAALLLKPNASQKAQFEEDFKKLDL